MSHPKRTSQLLSISLLSGAGMLLELSLTRIVSALYFPQYVFAVLALAILGIGLGAAAASGFPSLRQFSRLTFFVAGAGIAAAALLLLLVLTPVARLLPVVVVLLTLPYFFLGLSISTLFSGDSGNSPTLYLADLLGAGAGAVAAIVFMNSLGPISSILLAVGLFALAAYVLHPRSLTLLPTALLALTVIALLLNLSFGWLAFDLSNIDPEKPLADVMVQPGAELLETRWDAFARTDLVRLADEEFPRLYMDGAAGSIMPAAASTAPLSADIGFFPFATDQPERVLVIGPGGGLDVWFALQSRAREIVAVEVNPASIELVQQYARFNGDLYQQPGVRVVADDGRSALQRDPSTYDLIFLSQVVTLTAERTGLALSENTLYTVEAFAEYWSHLNDQGVIALKLYDSITAERALSTVLAMLEAQGIPNQDALRHLIALADPSHDPPVPLLMIRKQPYTRDDSLVYGQILRSQNFTPLFLPDLWVQPPLDAVWSGASPFAAVVASASADISPTSDDSPYFYQFEHGIPQDLQLLWGILGIVIILTAGFIGFQQRPVAHGSLRYAPLFFAGLGLAFIMVEVAIIQQTRVFLGHPTRALTIVLATILVGSGIGSGIGGRWLSRRLPIHLQIAALVVVMALWAIAWTPISQALSDSSLEVRMIAVILTVFPVALLMGMPFSRGLRIVGGTNDRLVALAWVANSVMTVVGTVASVTISILYGFSLVLVVGIGLYALSAAAAYISFRGTPPEIRSD